MHAVANEAWFFEPKQNAPDAWTHGEYSNGWFPGWPWWLDDQRPQGFLGRAFAKRVSSVLAVPDDPKQWSDVDIALALLSFGDDAPGNLVFGEQALRRALESQLQPRSVIVERERGVAYAAMAEAALRGDFIGSSAAGEQPKFTATLASAVGYRSVIVKFTERIGSAASRRWADLLYCEMLASRVLQDAGIKAAASNCLRADGRMFFESDRFDRTPSLGRVGTVSLAALDAAFYGHGAISWSKFAPMLLQDQWLSTKAAEQLAVLSWFGQLIGNSDMHLGNLSLLTATERPYELAPVYDMLPMRWRPAATGEVFGIEDFMPNAPVPLPSELEHFALASMLAEQFWQALLRADASDLSTEFQHLASAHLAQLEKLRARFG